MEQTKDHAGVSEAREPESDDLLVVDRIVERHRGEQGALIPVLQKAQQAFGYLSTEVIERIAARLEMPVSQVTGVVTFYSYFTTTPRGENTVRVCLGTACYVRSGKQVLEDLEKTLGVSVGETTADRCFSLEIGRCFGACGLAPVVMVNDDVHQRVKSTKLRELLEPYGCSNDVDGGPAAQSRGSTERNSTSGGSA